MRHIGLLAMSRWRPGGTWSKAKLPPEVVTTLRPGAFHHFKKNSSTNKVMALTSNFPSTHFGKQFEVKKTLQ